MDLNEFFDGTVKVKVIYRGAVTVHTLREMTAEEWMDFQRRTAFSVKNGEVRHTKESTGARLWLYDRLCQKVEVMDGDTAQDEPNFRVKVPPMLKDAAVGAMLAQIKNEDEEKN